jgi:ABC-2 type transport system ATP-binding protein
VQARHAEPIISVKDVTKTFDARTVVRGLSFEVMPGRIFGMIGPSGCGKTTTIRLVTGVYRPSSGSIRVMGREPIRFTRLDREMIGYMPQGFVLYPELSVEENLGFVAGLYGVIRGRRKEIRRALEFVELWDARRTLAGHLSGGMQRRLELAATLVHVPALMFVDEPTAGIDPVLRAKFWDGFRSLRDEGHTIFLTTQYVTEADYCDEIAVLREGKLLVQGAPSDIRRQVAGGEVLELQANGLDHDNLSHLRQMPGVHGVRIVSSDLAYLVVDDSASAQPEIQRAVEGLGLSVKRLGARQMTFDDIFVQLMKQADGGESSGPDRAGYENGAREPDRQRVPLGSAPGNRGSSDV